MIATRQLTVQAGPFRLSNIDFEIGDGEYGVLIGKTGCGKSTLLEAICGLKNIVSGRIELQGVDVTHLKPGERDIGFVPQDHALFSTMTVRQHLAFAPRIRRWPRHEIEKTVGELAEMLSIEALLDRRPLGLSGGETQRVSLGRALSARPGILCLDEPLSNLDAETAAEICDLLKSVQRATGVTALHVSHSRSETERLADRLYRLENGEIKERSVEEFKNL